MKRNININGEKSQENTLKRKISEYAKSKNGSNDSSQELVAELCSKTNCRGIKLPQYISFILEDDSTLLLYIQEQTADNGDVINALSNNMQGDNAAFEGWAVVLKAWCPDKASKVRLKWDVPSDGDFNSHYKRFCYRVVKMEKAYDWFSIDDTNREGIESFEKKLKEVSLKNNCGNSMPSKKFKHGGGIGENAVEYDMVHEQDFPHKLCEKYGVDNIFHQLPVGVKTDGDNQSFFAGNKAAIDLWGMKDNELTIIELKYQNKMVGIISELFFYVNIIRDIIKGDIAAPTGKLPHEKDLYERINKMKKIHARMLADEYHPLIKENVFKVLDNSTNQDVPIDYKCDTYIYKPSSLEFVQ